MKKIAKKLGTNTKVASVNSVKFKMKQSPNCRKVQDKRLFFSSKLNSKINELKS